MALSSTMQECLYLEQLLGGIDNYKYTQSIAHEDNQGTIALNKSPVNRRSWKHIYLKYHFIRSTVNEGRVTLMYCETTFIIRVWSKYCCSGLFSFCNNLFVESHIWVSFNTLYRRALLSSVSNT